MNGSEQVNFAQHNSRAEAIAKLNDKLRQTGSGGQLLITQGVLNLPGFDSAALLAALAEYDSFDANNDPHGERDFGDVTVFGTDLLWKIDYYDERLEYGSDDPADGQRTIRVLTVMLEMEY